MRPLDDYVPAEGADSIVAALAALIGSQYPVRVDGVVYHDFQKLGFAGRSPADGLRSRNAFTRHSGNDTVRPRTKRSETAYQFAIATYRRQLAQWRYTKRRKIVDAFADAGKLKSQALRRAHRECNGGMLDFLKPKPRDTVIARKYFEDSSDRKGLSASSCNSKSMEA